jgi:hypothetical protein
MRAKIDSIVFTPGAAEDLRGLRKFDKTSVIREYEQMGGRGKAQRAPAPSQKSGHDRRSLLRPPILSGTAFHRDNRPNALAEWELRVHPRRGV